MGCAAAKPAAKPDKEPPEDLEAAVTQRDAAAVQLLAGSASDAARLAALAQACRLGDATLLKLLLNAGANAEAAVDADGSTAILHAIKLADDPAEVVNVLIDTGAMVFKADTSGSTPLHAAAGRGLLPIVQALTGTMEVTLAAKDSQGRTAADVASQKGFAEIAARLSS